MYICPSCGASADVPLPIEPVYSIKTTAPLIPMAVSTLRSFLTHHKLALAKLNPPFYRRNSNTTHSRMLTASEVRYIRSQMLRQNESDTSRKKKRLSEV